MLVKILYFIFLFFVSLYAIIVLSRLILLVIFHNEKQELQKIRIKFPKKSEKHKTYHKYKCENAKKNNIFDYTKNSM